LPSRHAVPHLEESIRALKAAGHAVSIDSADGEELARGAKAGADFLLSLDEGTLDIAEGTGATPILVPAQHGDLDSLVAREWRPAARLSLSSIDPRSDPFRICRFPRPLYRNKSGFQMPK